MSRHLDGTRWFFFGRWWSDEFRALRRNTWPISKPFVRLPWDSPHALSECAYERLCVCICVSACLSLTKLSMKNNCGGYVLKNRTQNSQVVPKIFCHWFYSHILNQSWFVCYFFSGKFRSVAARDPSLASLSLSLKVGGGVSLGMVVKPIRDTKIENVQLTTDSEFPRVQFGFLHVAPKLCAKTWIVRLLRLLNKMEKYVCIVCTY